MERLAREKISHQQRLASLKKELTTRWDHIDLNAILPDMSTLDHYRDKETNSTTTASERPDADENLSLQPRNILSSAHQNRLTDINGFTLRSVPQNIMSIKHASEEELKANNVRLQKVHVPHVLQTKTLSQTEENVKQSNPNLPFVTCSYVSDNNIPSVIAYTPQSSPESNVAMTKISSPPTLCQMPPSGTYTPQHSPQVYNSNAPFLRIPRPTEQTRQVCRSPIVQESQLIETSSLSNQPLNLSADSNVVSISQNKSFPPRTSVSTTNNLLTNGPSIFKQADHTISGIRETKVYLKQGNSGNPNLIINSQHPVSTMAFSDASSNETRFVNNSPHVTLSPTIRPDSNTHFTAQSSATSGVLTPNIVGHPILARSTAELQKQIQDGSLRILPDDSSANIKVPVNEMNGNTLTASHNAHQTPLRVSSDGEKVFNVITSEQCYKLIPADQALTNGYRAIDVSSHSKGEYIATIQFKLSVG